MFTGRSCLAEMFYRGADCQLPQYFGLVKVFGSPLRDTQDYIRFAVVPFRKLKTRSSFAAALLES